MAEKMITLGRRAIFTQTSSFCVSVQGTMWSPYCLKQIARNADRVGGYTRVLKTGPRRGDGSEMAILNSFKEKRNTSRREPSTFLFCDGIKTSLTHRFRV